MSKKVIDLTGQKFGNLTVLKKYDNTTGKKCAAKWVCICECGNMVCVPEYNMKIGKSKSCGCLRAKTLSKNAKGNTLKSGFIRSVLGSEYKSESHKRLSRIWSNLKDRCLNTNNSHYSSYGGRGITVCDEWKNSFILFYFWSMSNGYKENLSIDRINNNGNYEPDNCRWITMNEQRYNTRQSVFITYNNKTQTITQWCKELNLSRVKTWKRIRKYNWSIEKALSV